MPQIKLTNVTKRWDNFYGVDNLNLVIDDNSFVTLLGPSGCGKTTTLRMIAGLETPTGGRIEIGDRVVFDSEEGINVPPNKRKVGFLFQNYALWPNMTVYENISFGLTNIKDDLPVMDVKYKQLADYIRVLSAKDRVLNYFNECKNEKDKLNQERFLLKVIDGFIVSIFTAKKVLKLILKKGFDVISEEVKNSEEELAQIKEKYNRKEIILNEKGEYVDAGTVVTDLRKLNEEEIDLAVRRVSRVVKIGQFMDRYPAELSGGQQQRVAIARTLAPEPTVLFMDEPLSNLDAKLRLEMRYELQRLHIETGSTFVYVTHDQMEAMTLSTKICLMNNGVLQQYDAPLDVYNKPNNLFVADFVGNPAINFIECKGGQNGELIDIELFGSKKMKFIPCESVNLAQWKADEEKRVTDAEEMLKQESLKKGYVEKHNKDEVFKYTIPLVKETEDDDKKLLGADCEFVIGVRPEFVYLREKGQFEGSICGAMPTGMESTIKLACDNFLLTSVVFGGVTYKIGTRQNFSFEGKQIMLFDKKSGRLICLGEIQ